MARLLLSFIVPGRLKGKQRARSTFKQAQPYPDRKTVNAEGRVAGFGYTAMAGLAPFDGPLIVRVEITINRTESWSKKKKAETHFVTGKPDIDNIAKLVGDGLNGIVWKDDAQIYDLHVTRRYDDAVPEQAKITVSQPAAPSQTIDHDPRQIPMFEEIVG